MSTTCPSVDLLPPRASSRARGEVVRSCFHADPAVWTSVYPAELTTDSQTCTRLGTISQDPIGFNAGDANLYRYVRNGPTNKTDPSGLTERPEPIDHDGHGSIDEGGSAGQANVGSCYDSFEAIQSCVVCHNPVIMMGGTFNDLPLAVRERYRTGAMQFTRSLNAAQLQNTVAALRAEALAAEVTVAMAGTAVLSPLAPGAATFAGRAGYIYGSQYATAASTLAVELANPAPIAISAAIGGISVPLHGTGAARGLTELSNRVKSSAALRVQLSRNGSSYEYVYLPLEQAFGINKRYGFAPNGSPHQYIFRALPYSGTGPVVGGIIRVRDGKLFTDEISGHFGRYWTDEIRTQFQRFLQDNCIEVIHGPY